MPLTADFIDACRLAFGAGEINEQIRAGLRGEATFWARENGHEVGSRPLERHANSQEGLG